ncbi:MAG TPA: class I SAM-dependent methyltransferase [Acidimicrobiales bacterium]|nr:class I SAM-dependent methyltransferase [Acidimicrobiales bacterium]
MTTSSSRDELGRRGFANGSLYDAVRPRYPVAAVEFLVETLALDESSHVLDLGAGSGIFSRQVRPYVGRVTAVEPSASMREALRESSVDIEALDGRDSEIPLPADSVHAVFAAQAFHWFDVDAALAEIHRVLIPRGGLGLIWNERDESVEWVCDLNRAMQWDRRQPYQVGMDFTGEVLRGSFDGVERHKFAHTQMLDHEGLRRRVLTTSYVSLMTEPERQALMDDVERVISELPAQVELPYITDVYRARAH